MTDRKNLGQVLQQLGRVSVEDQERALAYQRAHGGYFGEALVALGIITQGELEFGLAAQFNLPYVFPDPESIDPDAAALVTPEWALANLTLPIARSDETLSVVVDSPVKPEVVQELEARTGLGIELAIASPSRIRELIRHVFGGDEDDEVELRPATGVDDFLDEVLASGATRLGISLRARKVLGWWEERGRTVRRHLTSGWPGALERRLRPALAEFGSDADEYRDARLEWGGTELGVSVRRVASESGEELLMELRRTEDDPVSFDPPPPSVLDEIRLLARSGSGRFLVHTDPGALAAELLPHLPRVLLGAHARAVHLHGGDEPTSAFTLQVPADPEEALRFLDRLRAFRLDAATADLGSWPGGVAEGVARTAGAVFALLPEGVDVARAREAGFGWSLEATREEGARLQWSVRPLGGGR
jgi:type IV pilus assembly protein PilB